MWICSGSGFKWEILVAEVKHEFDLLLLFQ